ncbi:MAG TPA: hypothetical protein VMA73_13380, partial [Streptosporangiaceae bacterium]|nr:hypothetical protein [Streptosporangiaceae bacterium]
NLFFLGYVPEVLHFCECILAGTLPERGTMLDALHIMNFYETYQRTPAGIAGRIPSVDESQVSPSSSPLDAE